MAFILTPTDDCSLPMIGISITEDHEEWKEQLDCMLHRGDVYVEVPISGYLSEAAIKRIGEHARMKGLKREDFIISTSITVPEDAGAAVALVKEFVDHFCTHIDLLYLENPVGLKGTDPMTIYNTAPAGTHPKIRKVTDMFKRMREGYLKVTPRIMENLRMLWRVLEVELVATGAVHNLGLRHFSQEQVEKLLKGGVRHRPLALQAEVNPYREQRDLRCWCQEANIPLVGIHPYGSPLHVPSKDMPFLWKHPKVIKIAERVGVGPKVILSRHILQSRLRMVYDNTELFLPSFMTENIWRFQLTHGQMNKLGKLSKLPHKHPLGKYELLRVIDPCWPFSFPEETVKGGIRGEGTEANYKGDEEAEHKNIDEIKQAEVSGMMINKELKEERHEKKKITKVAEREIEMIEVYREEITTEREEEESTGKEEETEVKKGNTGEEVDEEEMEKEEEERSEVEDVVEGGEEEKRISEVEESEVEEEKEMNEVDEKEIEGEEDQNDEEEELEEEKGRSKMNEEEKEEDIEIGEEEEKEIIQAGEEKIEEMKEEEEHEEEKEEKGCNETEEEGKLFERERKGE